MKRLIIPLVVILFLVGNIPAAQEMEMGNQTVNHHPLLQQNIFTGASASGLGTNQQSVQNLTRTLTGLSLGLSNTYRNTANHISTLDLDGYQIPGWTLYRVDMDVDNLTATLEREVVGTTSTPTGDTEFQIYEHGLLLYYDVLVQGFYNQGHAGLLTNYSIYYDSPEYDLANQGIAYSLIRSTYSSASSNITEPTQIPHVGYTKTWNTTTVSVNLTASTQYYVCIDGSNLIDLDLVTLGGYPKIRWYYVSGAGDFETRRHNTDGPSWGSDRPLEALLNYSYIPWDTAYNKPLVFSSPEEVLLKGNGTDLTGSTYTFYNDGSNIKSILFTSNQSLDIFHNITLMYSRIETSSLDWEAQISGGSVLWNATTALTFPEVSGSLSKSMTITKPSDWTATGLYNSTDLSTDYGNYVDTGTSVTCSLMTNGTWILTSTAHNYVTSIQSQPITSIVTVNENIPAVVEDEFLNPADSGTANYTITYESSTVRSVLRPVSVGFATYTWNVNADASTNGTYIIEVFWSNGTEAGYLTKEIVVYYPTSLTGNTQLESFTDSSFEIRVDFVDTFSPTYLTSTYASVVYSYDSGSNKSLMDLGNGTWTATILTAGNVSGLHSVVVYAEGYAIQNQSLSIDVILTYHTSPITYNWTNPQENDITYLQSTSLTVRYEFANGTPIENAIVNVTDGTTTWTMSWNPIGENYTIQFNGTDFSSFPAAITLTVNAWKIGHEAQANGTIQLNISEESATSLSVTITPSDLNMTFVESIRVVANYSFEGAPITSGALALQFNTSTPITLEFNATDGLWYVIVDGSDIGLGYWEFSISADAIGYASKSSLGNLEIWEDIPTLTDSWTNHEGTTDYETIIALNITALDSFGYPVVDTNLTVTLLSSSFTMTHLGNGIYTVNIIPEAIRGTHQIAVILTELGFRQTTIHLNLTILATTEIVVANLISGYETEQIVIVIGFIDSVHDTMIDWGSVNLTVDEETYPAVYNGSFYIVILDLDYDVNYYSVTIEAAADGVNPATEGTSLQVRQKSYVYIIISYSGNPFQGNTISIDALLRENNTDRVIPFVTLRFNVTVHYENGTIVLTSGQDSTNAQGIASIPFDIPPAGEIAITSIEVQVFYDGPVEIWDVTKVLSIPVNLSPLDEALSFFFVREGRFVLLGLMLLAVVVVGYNKRIKPKKRAVRKALEDQLQTFNDLKHVQHFMAVYVNRGTCVFYHPFKEARIQADLISGFISAVTSVYGEIKGDGVQGTLEEIQYQGLRLNSYSGEYVLGILILDGEISETMRDRLTFFVEIFENEYETHLDGWTGITDCFDPEWIVSNLVSTLGYSWMLPHLIDHQKKLSGIDKKIMNYVQASLGDKREFLIEDYLEPLASMFGKTEAEILDILLKLEDMGIIHPISVHTFLQRQGLGLVNGELEMGFTPIEDLRETDESELEEIEEDVQEESPAPEDEEIESDIAPEEEESKEELESSDAVEESVPEEKEAEKDPREEFIKEVESLLKKDKDDEDDT